MLRAIGWLVFCTLMAGWMYGETWYEAACIWSVSVGICLCQCVNELVAWQHASGAAGRTTNNQHTRSTK